MRERKRKRGEEGRRERERERGRAREREGGRARDRGGKYMCIMVVDYADLPRPFLDTHVDCLRCAAPA